MKTFFKYILLLFFSGLQFSCSHKIQLKENEYLLGEQEFDGVSQARSEELTNLIPLGQRPNNKPLNIPWFQLTPKVWRYNYGLNNFDEEKQKEKLWQLQTKLALYSAELTTDERTRRIKQRIQKKIERTEDNIETKVAWLWRNIGEPQAVINSEDVEQTAAILEKYLKDVGFKDATVSHELDSLLTSDKYKLIYHINEGIGYQIDTVFYEIEDRRLDSLVNAHDTESLITSGDLFNIQKVEAEKARIELLAKQNGYYNFRSQYIIHEAINANFDEVEFHEKKRGNLRFRIINPPNQKVHKAYKIKEIVFKGFNPNSTEVITNADTVEIGGINYITLNSNIPKLILDKKVTSRPGQVYNISRISETQRQIGLLNQFAFANSQIKALNDEEISLEYYAPQLPKYAFNASPGFNYISNAGSSFLGFGVPISITARNWWKRLELFEASAHISREGQPSPTDTKTVGKINPSWEMGANLNVTFPGISFFGKDIESIKLKNPRSQFGLGVNYSEPYWGNRLNFSLSSNYRWQPSRYTTVVVALLDANLINTNYNRSDSSGIDFYNSLLRLEELGNNLKTTFDPQFVSSVNTTYIYNDQDLQKPYASSKYFRFFVESGGTLLNFAKDKSQINFIEKLRPLRPDYNSPDSVRQYFRFIKVNIDYRRYINLAPESSLAYRINIGIANPYGNKSLPYDKNFFIGGSNSVRAWKPRSLGVGSAKPDVANGYIIPQAGDVLLEGSLEYRKKVARFWGDIQLAGFIDVGNIWKWHQIETEAKKDKANFDFGRFYKEIAVGTGFGIRYDVSYFQFRFDWGIKVMDPSRDEGDRFVLDEFRFGRYINKGTAEETINRYKLNFNLGIGYPF